MKKLILALGILVLTAGTVAGEERQCHVDRYADEMEVAAISTNIKAKFASEEAAIAFMAVLIEMDHNIEIELNAYTSDFVTGGEECPTYWLVRALYEVEVPVEDW